MNGEIIGKGLGKSWIQSNDEASKKALATLRRHCYMVKVCTVAVLSIFYC